ncbi:uncharacterized protein LACBIDRAFT_328196 [Laccaria bicolor S238N-H82]|uniref:Predicted protein n=1 Tax=Laccaria bicolor (strain S238N-H82 / ATCC MYA-4686) TaxID=486041 RepID=B0DE15_LACBS|nr:uncharacterized protein LACBIDRAFT_328194 [Laccaria bicolor S238N-H82]XP_001882116.1 uncharacterized protein LACBIDRAFT_328196 [Laccaria bicolor S238N-H82]EDR07184.1 predicted protein [Laccaria bicolor S238N-H82]EDR07185.1 predicted protein [Laccaria bicolor S238N-H82]|eukprot:XP_001882115.1 predicted protein [Laccaria bicolor S238N-H82]
MSTLPGRDHTSSSTPSLDGEGGPDSASQDGTPTKRTGPNYVYYRLYTKLGPFESIRPLYDNDRFIGRIPTKSFAPPHTVASIKWSICKLEGLRSEADKALLFTQLSNPEPNEDSARLSLFAPSGPGLFEQDPIVLVDDSYPNRALMSFAVYYRVYSSKGGDQKAKTSFDQTDISLGRLNALFIAPPHTAGSLKARIAKVERLVTPGHALYQDMELFQDMTSDTAMSDTNVISFQGDTYPGSDEGDPVALVNATANIAADQKTKLTPGKVLSEYPLVTAATNRALSDGPDSKFTKRGRLLLSLNYSDSAWLSIIKDEIVYTDGVIVSKIYSLTNCISFLFCFITRPWSGYMVINSKGEKGFVRMVNTRESVCFWNGICQDFGSEGVNVPVP